jgi:hypothetical protein
MEQELKAFLESDRAWPRIHRYAHYQYKLKYALTDEHRAFWQAALEKTEE